MTNSARGLRAKLKVTLKFQSAHGPRAPREDQMQIQRWIKIIAICLFVTAGSGQLDAADDLPSPVPGQRIFYTGHSFHMFVPPRIEQLVKSAEIQGHQLAGIQGLGGSRVIQHWDLEDGKNKAKPALESGQVDVFTMSAHLEIPDPGITNFVELGLKHNPKMRFLVQASWMPFDITSLEHRVRDNAERDQTNLADLEKATDVWLRKMELQVDELNQKHGRTAVYIVPVGNAVNRLREMIVAEKYPGVKKQSELFRDSIGHGLGHVQALAAYCNFVAIYRRNPEGLQLKEPGVDEAQHSILQSLAWKTVSEYSHSGVSAKGSTGP